LMSKSSMVLSKISFPLVRADLRWLPHHPTGFRTKITSFWQPHRNVHRVGWPEHIANKKAVLPPRTATSLTLFYGLPRFPAANFGNPKFSRPSLCFTLLLNINPRPFPIVRKKKIFHTSGSLNVLMVVESLPARVTLHFARASTQNTSSSK